MVSCLNVFVVFALKESELHYEGIVKLVFIITQQLSEKAYLIHVKTPESLL